MPRLTLIPYILLVLVGVGWLVAQSNLRNRDIPHIPRDTPAQVGLSDHAHQTQDDSGNSEQAEDAHFPVMIRQPSGPPTVTLTSTDPHGRSASVACSTCHSIRAPQLSVHSTAELNEFHNELRFAHGNLTCYACHNPKEMDSLHLADGKALDFTNVMDLCSQCHGLQASAYAHGAHGGMTGFWDLERGSQQRNNCIDCHNPHIPKFPKMIPTFKPRDRFLNSQVDKGSESDTGHSSED